MAIILRKGDKGDKVKTLQKALGITVDGDFGVKTETSVKLFQKSKNIMVDGIVGAITQRLLGISFDDKSKVIDIQLSPITKNITKKTRDVKYIVIHYTAGTSSEKGKAISIRNLFNQSGRSASADFVVDDETIVQCNNDPKNYYCWAVGDGKGKYGVTNTNSISIEMCSTLKKGTSLSAANHSGWSISEKVLNKTIELTKYLMSKYSIPLDKVIRHYDASGKYCPGIVGWNDGALYDEVTGKPTTKKNNSSEWNNFKKQLI